jgi:hypothetical protein
MPSAARRLGRAGAVIVTLAATFLIALTVPIPVVPDAGRAAVRAEVRDRLPGWTVSRLHPSWEGAYTVVTNCADRQVAFQFVPGHGLPVDDAWIQPTNRYARARLAITSDHRQYLVWRDGSVSPTPLQCVDQVAQADESEASSGPAGAN